MAIKLKLKQDRDTCTLAKCPPGLFLFEGTLGFRTEYEMEVDKKFYPQAFVVSSGEIFWGGVHSHEERSNLIVQPLWGEYHGLEMD